MGNLQLEGLQLIQSKLVLDLVLTVGLAAMSPNNAVPEVLCCRWHQCHQEVSLCP